MRHSTIAYALPLLLAVSLPAAALVPGCSNTSLDKDCSVFGAGYTVYLCDFSFTANKCGAPSTMTRMSTCATGLANAITQINNFYPGKYLWNLACTNTGLVNYQTNSLPNPKLMPEGLGSCDPSAGDDACASCAKATCCDAYLACFNDVNCTCLVACMFQGGTLAMCTAADNCGAPSAATASIQDCLSTSCPSQCPDVGGMASSMCPTMTGTGGGASTGTTCTPGPSGSSEPCSSDGDCASCSCNAQSMTCN